MSITTRPTVAEDLETFASWEAANSSGAGWSLSALRDELAARHGTMITALRAGTPVGYLALRDLADGLELMNILVAPEQRRRGVARLLMAALIERAADRPIWLELREGNGAALALYRALGFVAVGRRPRYYRDGETALLMRRDP